MPGATATAAPKASSTMINPKDKTSGKKGLSTGAKAAIGASIGASVLIIALVMALLYIRKRRKTGVIKDTVVDTPYAYTPVHEMQQVQQLDGRDIEPMELPAGKGSATPDRLQPPKDALSELGNSGVPAELPGHQQT